MQPEERPWRYIEHKGWSNAANPDRFTPPIPLVFVRMQPPPDWKIKQVTDSEIVLHEKFSNGMTIAFYIDRETRLVNREETEIPGLIVGSVMEYSRYGKIDARGMHRDKNDCEARN